MTTEFGRTVDVERGSFHEFFLTATAPDREDSRRILEWTAATMAERKILPIQERIYGTVDRRDEILALRNEVYPLLGSDPRVPVTYLEGKPIAGRGIAGVQIWGIAPNGAGPVDVRTIETPDGGRARCWNGRGFRMLYHPMIRDLGTDAPAQAERMFANAGEILKANGFSWRQVARTWIYLADILGWYDDFNRVRTAHYAKEGLGPVYPASTGIQGRCAEEACFMSLLAIDAGPSADLTVGYLRKSRRQNPASAYGSAFSRGATIAMGGRTTVHVSGTASIDANGATIHEGDVEAQAQETLTNVAALLEECGGGLENICSGTLFCKTHAAEEAFRNVRRRLNIPDFPVVPMIADVCRHNLLLELEAVAVI